MSKVRVAGFSISLDGYGAGREQSLAQPMGVGGMALHQWILGTRTFKQAHGDFAGDLIPETVTAGDIDDRFAARALGNLGAWILGRHMFAPSRGAWPDDGWKGWWGPSPPYHVPVFVLTHHSRPPLEMEGGTTFHFVTDGIESALARAKAAANGKDVRIGGGTATVRQYLTAGLVDEVHLAISPVLLGQGEHLLHDLDLVSLGYRCTEHVASAKATHVVLTKSSHDRSAR
jgi:dihydrofolate reductase